MRDSARQRRATLAQERDKAVQEWLMTREDFHEGLCGAGDVAAATAAMEEAVATVTRFDAENPGVRTSEDEEGDRRVLDLIRLQDDQ